MTDYLHYDKPSINLLSNSGFGVWSNATISNVSPPINIGGVTNGVAVAFVPSGATTHSVTTGCLVRYGGTSVYEVTAKAGGTTFTLNDLSVNESGVSFYVFVPACVVANALGPDGWAKSNSGIYAYREHSGSNTKDGAFYALKTVSLLADKTVYTGNATLEPWLTEMAGRIITQGMWIKTSTASHARVYTYDNITGYTFSSYHSGGGSYEWLEVTTTVAVASTNTYAGVRATQSSGIIYISQPILIFGSSIGKGNYMQMPGEQVHCETEIIFADYSGTTTVINNADINVETQSRGKIPKGAVSMKTHLHGQSAQAGKLMSLISETGGIEGVHVHSMVANQVTSESSQVICDADGDVRIELDATFVNVGINIRTIQVS